MISGRRHRRELAAASAAYRWERDEAIRRAERAETERDQTLDRLVRARVHRGDMERRLTVMLDCDDLLVHYQPRGDEYQRLAQRIVLALSRLGRDYRGDLRQTDTQRALGL